MRRSVLTLSFVLLLSACGAADGPVVQAPSTDVTAAPAATSEPSADDHGRVWFEVVATSPSAPSDQLLELATTSDGLAALWDRYGMDGAVPDVDLDTEVMLFVGRGDDGCPDRLVALTPTDGIVETTWLPPPGGCIQPYISTGHAVRLHRGDLGAAVTIAFRDPNAGDVVETFELPPYDGPTAPAAPDVPTRPSEDEIAALFEGHPLRPCAEFPSPLDEQGTVDGPLSQDPAVAAAQQARADLAFPSDIDTVTAVLADPGNTDRGLDASMTQEEFDSIFTRQDLGIEEELAAYTATHADTYGFRYLSQARGGVMVVGFTDQLDERRAELAAMFPAAPIDVVTAPATEPELRAIVDGFFGPGGRDQEPTVSHGAAGLTHAELGLFEPTRDDLDAVADRVEDPTLVCIQHGFSGLPAESATDTRSPDPSR